MLLLTSTADLLRVLTSAAVTVDVHASFVDLNGSTVTPARTNTAISTATTTTVVGSPAASTQRTVKALLIRNTHASSAVDVTVIHTDGTTAVNVVKATLAAGAALQYDEGSGFRRINSLGIPDTSDSLIGRHAIYIAAGSIRPSATGGCQSVTTIVSGASQPDIVSLDFDPTTQEYAQFGIVMPKKWNEGTITFKAHWSHAATTTNFGVVWDLQAVAVSDDDAIAVAFGTAQVVTDTGGTTNDLYTSPESAAITVSGTPAAEDTVFYRFSRVTGDAGDTMAIDARLHGITLYVTINAETDA